MERITSLESLKKIFSENIDVLLLEATGQDIDYEYMEDYIDDKLSLTSKDLTEV